MALPSSKTLRVPIDSAPLQGSGRVEDTINLLARAARKVVDCAAELLRSTRSASAATHAPRYFWRRA
jgi:hypothetical protein